MLYSYSRTRTAGAPIPYPDPTYSYVAVWVEIDSYGRIHHVTGDLKQAEKILETSRSSIIAAQSEMLEQGLAYKVSEITVDGSANSGRNKMVVSFHVSPVGNNSFSDIEQGMIMSKFKGVARTEKKMPTK